MKVAITYWGTRIAPLFDTARKIMILDIEDNDIKDCNEVDMDGVSSFARVGYLHELGVEVLFCGGISEHFFHQLLAAKIKVIPWISGEVADVIEKYLLESGSFKKFR
jgi:predicted Fe-Mo cluster-binding NifX family protein